MDPAIFCLNKTLIGSGEDNVVLKYPVNKRLEALFFFFKALIYLAGTAIQSVVALMDVCQPFYIFCFTV